MANVLNCRPEDRVSVSQAAAEIGIAASTVTHHIRNGELPAEKVAGVWLIRYADVLSFKEDRPSVGWPKGRSRKEGG